MVSDPTSVAVYRLDVLLLGVSPAVWRLLEVRSDHAIDDLHATIAVRLPSPRYYRCRCESRGRSSISPVAAALPQRSTAEFVYLQSKWASLMSYGLTIRLLEEVLPLGGRPAQRSVRRQLHCVATPMEDDLGDEIAVIAEPDPGWADPATRPGPPLTVGIDGGYVHAREGDNRKAGWFEVIAGCSAAEQGPSKCFAMVHRLDAKPRKRVAAVLASQDLVPRQTVWFISDGGDTVRNLQRYLHAEAEHGRSDDLAHPGSVESDEHSHGGPPRLGATVPIGSTAR